MNEYYYSDIKLFKDFMIELGLDPSNESLDPSTPEGIGNLAAKAVIDSAKLFSVVVNIGDSKSLIVHPASTTHSQMSENELAEAGVNPTTVRLSIGLEDPKDLIEDLIQALG